MAMQDEPKPPFKPQSQQAPGLDAEMSPVPNYAGRQYQPSGKLKGKAALVTGGDSGIGRSVAVLFAKEGADVAIVYTPPEQSDAEAVRKDIEATGQRVLLLPGDVKDSSFCQEAVESTVKAFGRLDVLVNNAAIMPLPGSLLEITDAQLDEVFRTNIFGYFYMARAAVPHMKHGGAIINTGSVAGIGGFPKAIHYSATKGAIHSFTRSLAQDLLPKNITVNCVAPGPVWTPLNASNRDADDMATYGGESPQGRPAQPEEMAPAYVFFASAADGGYVTGEVLQMFHGGG